jgi:general stress protein 26
MPTEVESFAEIEAEFVTRVSSVIWCNMATIDTVGRPRSRIVHPVWEGSIGWVASRPTSFKVKHLAATPYVSLAYVADTAKPVYVDCSVEWVKTPAEKVRVWDFIKSQPDPYGFDPATLFPNGADDPGCGFLKLTPWRLEVANFQTGAMLVWRPKEE